MPSKNQYRSQREELHSPENLQHFPFRTIAVVAIVVVVGAIVLKTRLAQQSPVAASPLAPVAQASPIQNSAPAPMVPVSSGDIYKLKGRWQRSGENYVLEVRDINSQGVINAAYSNPNPIRVGQAAAQVNGGQVALLVVLNDPEHGYPGCTYRLLYDAQHDILVGTYYQATQQQNYDVTFERVK